SRILRLVVAGVVETYRVGPHGPPRPNFGGDVARVDPAREERPNLDVGDLVSDYRFRTRVRDSVHEVFERLVRLEGEGRGEVAANDDLSVRLVEDGVSRGELADILEERFDAGHAVPQEVVGK